MKLVFVVLAVLALSFSAQASVIFADNFDGVSVAGNLLTVNSPGTVEGWNITAGSVDVLNNYPGLMCNSNGQCVDMDGSNTTGGTMERYFNFAAGLTYTLSFYYSGNQRGAASDSMTATIGTQTLSLTNIAPGTPWTQAILQFTPSQDVSGVLRFAHGGGDNIGMLVDDVVLSDSTVPEPSTLLLGGIGIGLVAVARRQFARR